MIRPIVIACVALILASSASAQVIYLPVQYQFGTREKFYYGGNDPRMVSFLSREVCRSRGDINGSRAAAVSAVYTDCLPYRDASIFGFTAADASNEANANVPRYFRKRDLLDAPSLKTVEKRIAPRPASNSYIDIRPYVQPPGRRSSMRTP